MIASAKRFFVFIALASTVGFSVWSLYESVRIGTFRVQTIELGLDEASEDPLIFLHFREEVEKKLARYSGLQIWSVDVNEIDSRLRTVVWIDSVQVRRRLPNEILVRILPKTVSAIVMSSRGDVVPVADDGSLLPDMPAVSAPDVPVFGQPEFLQDPEMRKQALAVLRDLPSEGPVSRKNLSEITVDKKSGFWLTLMNSAPQIRIGSDNVPLRAARIEKVLRYLEEKNMSARVIDADFSKKVVVKLRKDR